MPLSPEDNKQLGIIYRNLRDDPIGPDDPFYVPILENTKYDPIQLLSQHIQWSEIESLQLFSGFSGSGKTTQLRRLQKELESAGYKVLYADAEDYLNLSEPIDITEFLVTVAGAFSDQLDSKLLIESYWNRLLNYLRTTKVEISAVTLKTSAADLKAELKTSPTFRQELQKALNPRLRELNDQVTKFIEEAVTKADAAAFRLVFLFDSFEKLRGTPSNEQEVMDSIERVFGTHLQLLQLPSVHCVYSVPSWLRYTVKYSEIVVIPTLKMWHKRGRTETQARPDEKGFMTAREILRRRFTSHEECARVFGPPDENSQFPLAERLLESSGGALRDMLRLFRVALLGAQELPLTPAQIDTAIGIVRDDFRVSVEDARWLYKIHEEQWAAPETDKAAHVNLLNRLLDSHLVLYYRNDEDWYDSHPLVREEVNRIVAFNPEPATAEE
jgi:hypothetical protein